MRELIRIFLAGNSDAIPETATTRVFVVIITTGFQEGNLNDIQEKQRPNSSCRGYKRFQGEEESFPGQVRRQEKPKGFRLELSVKKNWIARELNTAITPGGTHMDPRVLEVRDFAPANENKGGEDAFSEVRNLMSSRPDAAKDDTQNNAVTDGDGLLKERAARASEDPMVKEAYKQLLEKTKGIDPKIVEDSLNLASDLAATGLKFPGMGAAGEIKPSTGEQQEAFLDPRVSGAMGRIVQKFLNPLVIKDIINIGGDLAQIAMSPQGQQLIADIKSLVIHLKQA